jgi:hypothetical protein
MDIGRPLSYRIAMRAAVSSTAALASCPGWFRHPASGCPVLLGAANLPACLHACCIARAHTHTYTDAHSPPGCLPPVLSTAAVRAGHLCPDLQLRLQEHQGEALPGTAWYNRSGGATGTRPPRHHPLHPPALACCSCLACLLCPTSHHPPAPPHPAPVFFLPLRGCRRCGATLCGAPACRTITIPSPPWCAATSRRRRHWLVCLPWCSMRRNK